MLHSLLTAILLAPLNQSPPPNDPPAPDARHQNPGAEADPAQSPSGRGLRVATEQAQQGYTLISPLRSTVTRLVDMQGHEVHRWESEYTAGNSAYLLADGSLLRCGKNPGGPFSGGGEGGVIEQFAWDGELLWTYHCSDNERRHHHDIEPLPNGNVLVIAWEGKTSEQVLSHGRPEGSLQLEPQRSPAGGPPRGTPAPDAQSTRPEDDAAPTPVYPLWPTVILEVQPTRPTGGQVVWEWHAFDHLIQDYNENAAHFGIVAEHPERIDINAGIPDKPPSAEERKRTAELEQQMRALGYLGGDEDDGGDGDEPDISKAKPDWLHVNGIDYNAKHDLIVISSRTLSEVWIIDHSTTTEQAASSSGGRHGMGGDLLFRWGNPQNYGRGTRDDRTLYGQHDPRFVEAKDGSLHLTLFNNGDARPEPRFSSVDEIRLPMVEGKFVRSDDEAFDVGELVWTYRAADPPSFFASFISGAERLACGNTLICSGVDGRAFEVTPEGEIVWEFLHPFDDTAAEDSPGPGSGRPRARSGRRGPPPGRPLGPPPHPRPGRAGAPQPRGRGGLDPHALFRVTRIPIDAPSVSRLNSAG